jgi:hypothetical protein
MSRRSPLFSGFSPREERRHGSLRGAMITGDAVFGKEDRVQAAKAVFRRRRAAPGLRNAVWPVRP